MAPKRLSHYELGNLLGRGGMGEVYRARDTRLDRDVAIKVLPEALVADADLQQRFEREARTISSLNHPNICTLHDVGQEGDTRFLVMELVDGLTLAQRIKDKPLALKDVFTFGAQIADALDRAHRAGVIHRDLKPANVMITSDGAKLMDFGLARVDTVGGAQDATVAASPTHALPLTQEGALVGTYQYMAPEQLEGGAADHRSDLWALGCVLYEMATGTRAFEGKTQASVIGSILHHEPAPIADHAELAPPELDRIVRACLAKDPDQRLQSAHDVKLQLAWLRDGAPSSSTIATPPRLPRRRSSLTRAITAAAVAAAFGAIVTFALVGREASSPDTFVQRPLLSSLGEFPLNPMMSPIIAPDARGVFLAMREGLERRIVRRDFDRMTLETIEGTDGGFAPFLSPDGRWLGFLHDDGVRKVPIDGGVSQIVTSLKGVDSAEWGEDGWIYMASGSGSFGADTALMRVRESGGTAEAFGGLDAERGEVFAWLPEVLPGGETVLASTGGVSSTIVAFGRDGSRHVVVENAFLARFVAPDLLLYQDVSTQALAAVRFDPVAAEVTSGPVILTQALDGAFCFDVSPDDVLVFVPDPAEGDGLHLSRVDPDGKVTRVSDLRGTWAQPRISPDGNRILVRKIGGECELWMLDLQRNSFSRIVQDGDTHDPLWGPDGRQIVFVRNGASETVLMDVTGSRTTAVLASGRSRVTPESWSAGGNLLVTTRTADDGRSDIWLRSMDDPEAPPQPFMTTPANESSPAISPDGAWMAYTSDETGTPEVFVRPVPDDGRAWQISTRGASDPTWSHDGRKLYFTSQSSEALMVADVDIDGGSLTVGIPRVHLEGTIDRSRPDNYDVAPDGSIVTVVSPDGILQPEVHVLTNWKRLEAERRGVTGGR